MLKKRKARLDYADCQRLAGSREGIASLATPSVVKRSSRDPHRGLYPAQRPRMSRSAASSSKSGTSDTVAPGQDMSSRYPSFQTAHALLLASGSGSSDGRSSAANRPENGRTSEGSPVKRKRAKTMPQNNKITRYFETSPKKLGAQFDEGHRCSPAAGPSTLAFVGSVKEDSRWQYPLEVDSDGSDDSVVITEVFGLLCPEVVPETKLGNPFDRLPAEVLEAVFANISLQELLLTCNRVCRRWLQVIGDPTFLQHRKRYYKFKAGNCRSVVCEVQRISESEGMCSTRSCLPGLIRYMLKFKKDAKGLQAVLRKHEKYEIATEVLQEGFRDCFFGKFVHPWCNVAALVVVSESVQDIFQLFHPSLDNLALSEALYCIATFLLHFQKNYNINHGYHYRTYYALHLYENMWSGTLKDLTAVQQSHKGQQNILKFGTSSQRVKYTHEQMRVINHELSPNDIVRIIAFAGTGKTSTLVEYARLRPSKKFLCIVYNKSVSEIGKRTFSSNVECRTAHSLAFRSTGFRYRDKMTSKVRVLDVSRLVSMPPGLSLNKQRFSKLVIQSVEHFLSSADELLTTAHVPQIVMDLENNMPIQLSSAQRLAVADEAASFWEKMADPNNKEVRMTHDGYLKLFQLQKPRLGAYDCIFVDEAQDCNPAMLDFILAQSCPKILVGDPNQQIYAFRRAIDALSSVPGTHTFYLTKSFRFGPEIGYIASCALETLKGISNKTIVGSAEPGKVDGSISGQVAVIARSNLTLFNQAVEIVCNEQYRRMGLSHVNGAFIGGIAGYGFQQILDIYKLCHKPEDVASIKDSFVRRFDSFAGLRSYARNAEDVELLARILFVEEHVHAVPQYVRTLEMKCSGNDKLANIVFTTAHKAKGLEFDTVMLADDFFVGNCSLGNHKVSLNAETIQEYNVLYVAMTRAKKRLCMSRAIYFLLLQAQEKYEFLQSRDSAVLEVGGGVLTCCSCEEAFEPSGKLVLQRRSFSVAGQTSRGGFLCKACATCAMFQPFLRPHVDMMNFNFMLPDYSHESLSAIFDCVL
uniref:Putative 3'-5' dna helicase n=1 Tax=Ixodes ricinus TaxID=34613 RepID=A0A147BDJ4_IXORI